MISRSFFFFNLSSSINFSRFYITHFFSLGYLSKISLGIFFPNLLKMDDLRLVLSYIILLNLFGKQPVIKRFCKKQYEIDGTKFSIFRIFVILLLKMLINFCYWFFIWLYLFVHYYNVQTLMYYFSPKPFFFLCTFRQINFFPGLTEKFFLYNSLFCIRFFFKKVLEKQYIINLSDFFFTWKLDI